MSCVTARRSTRWAPAISSASSRSIASGGQRNATIVATSPVKMLSLSAHYMRVIRERMPRIGEQIDSVIAQRTH